MIVRGKTYAIDLDLRSLSQRPGSPLISTEDSRERSGNVAGYPTGPAAWISFDTEANFSKFLWKRAARSFAAWS